MHIKKQWEADWKGMRVCAGEHETCKFILYILVRHRHQLKVKWPTSFSSGVAQFWIFERWQKQKINGKTPANKCCHIVFFRNHFFFAATIFEHISCMVMPSVCWLLVQNGEKKKEKNENNLLQPDKMQSEHLWNFKLNCVTLICEHNSILHEASQQRAPISNQIEWNDDISDFLKYLPMIFSLLPFFVRCIHRSVRLQKQQQRQQRHLCVRQVRIFNAKMMWIPA